MILLLLLLQISPHIIRYADNLIGQPADTVNVQSIPYSKMKWSHLPDTSIWVKLPFNKPIKFEVLEEYRWELVTTFDRAAWHKDHQKYSPIFIFPKTEVHKKINLSYSIFEVTP